MIIAPCHTNDYYFKFGNFLLYFLFFAVEDTALAIQSFIYFNHLNDNLLKR